jgi:hypothetical protein
MRIVKTRWCCGAAQLSSSAARSSWRNTMSRSVVLVAAMFLASCSTKLSSSPDKVGVNNDASAANSSVTDGATATMSLLGTTWEFDDDGVPTVVTIDQAGGYIEERADGTHVVHGTYEQRDGKDCFTSAMGDKRTSCWTAVPRTEIGQTASATHDKGDSAVFTRVTYRELKQPRD